MKTPIFIDIETVPETQDYDNYTKRYIRAERYCNDIQTTEKQAYFDKWSLFPEFAKIICISIGLYDKEKDIVKKKTFYSRNDEKWLLEDFFKQLDQLDNKYILTGHNILDFDIPFIYRRSIINRIKPHAMIDQWHLKPREVEIIDTMKIWKQFWYISTWIELICMCLNIPNPKKEINWKNIKDIYREISTNEIDEQMEKIKQYCESDVEATARIYLRINNPELSLNPKDSSVEEAQSKLINDDLPFNY